MSTQFRFHRALFFGLAVIGLQGVASANTGYAKYAFDHASAATTVLGVSSFPVGWIELTLGTGGNGITNGAIQFKVSFAAPSSGSVSVFDGFWFNSSISPNPNPLTISSATSPWVNGAIAPGSYNVDGLGTYEYQVTGPKQGANSTSSLQFEVSRTGSFTDVHQLVSPATGSNTGNCVGCLFATHFRNSAVSGTNTAFVAALGEVVVSTVPEPHFTGVLTLGVAGLFWFRSRLRRTVRPELS